MSQIPAVLMIKRTRPGALAVVGACISLWLSNNSNFNSSGREVCKWKSRQDQDFGTEQSSQLKMFCWQVDTHAVTRSHLTTTAQARPSKGRTVQHYPFYISNKSKTCTTWFNLQSESISHSLLLAIVWIPLKATPASSTTRPCKKSKHNEQKKVEISTAGVVWPNSLSTRM